MVRMFKKGYEVKIDRLHREHTRMYTEYFCFFLIRDLSRSFFVYYDGNSFIIYGIELL